MTPIGTSARTARTARTALVTLAAATLLLGACSSSSSGSKPSASSTSTTTTPAAPLTILVTNDDGFGAPGIDVVAQALSKLDNVKVTIVAPATNQSGTGSKSTPGPLTGTDATTASGLAATSVTGFPVDAVTYAFETLKLNPDVVVSGINAGQNLGPITAVSGTVGAAKAASGRGVPAIAASQGLSDTPAYETGAQLVVDWITAHRKGLLAGEVSTNVVNLNIPSCPGGTTRGVKQVPLSTSSDGAVSAPDCTSTVADVVTDIAAFLNGFASVTELTSAGETVTTSTTWPAAKS